MNSIKVTKVDSGYPETKEIVIPVSSIWFVRRGVRVNMENKVERFVTEIHLIGNSYVFDVEESLEVVQSLINQ